MQQTPYLIVAGDFNNSVYEASRILAELGLTEVEFPSGPTHAFQRIDKMFSTLGQPTYCTSLKTKLSDHSIFVADFPIITVRPAQPGPH